MLLVSSENKDIKIYLIFNESHVCVNEHFVHILDGFDNILSLFRSIDRRTTWLKLLYVFRILDSHNKPVSQGLSLPKKFNMANVY